MKESSCRFIALAVAFGFSLVPLSVAHADLVFDINFPQVNSSTVTSAPISGSCDTESAAIEISVSDGVTSTTPAAATCTGGSWSANLDLFSLVDGPITASVSIGEESAVEAPSTKDVTPPVIAVYVGDGAFSLVTLAEGYIFDTSEPLFEFSSDDSIAVLTCAVDGGGPSDCLSDFFYQASGLADGPHTLTLSATDDVGTPGNSGETTTNFCVNTCEEGGGGDPVDTIQIAIRDGVTLIGPIELELPEEGTADVALSPTGTTTTYDIPARSVLALLSTFDATSTDFVVTDLAYFSSFSSFIVNCINVPAASATDECFSWTYAVNGAFPSVGMDATELVDGDVVYVFFGSAWQVSVSDSTVEEDEEFTATIEKYDAELGAYEPAEGEVAGAVQFDAFFTPTEFATSTTNAAGEATLSLSDAGEYFVGAQSVFYFPNAALTVTEPEEEESGGGGGGGGSGGTTHLSFNVPAALAYLSSKQQGNGSYGDSLFTDWVAMAFAAQDPGSAKTALRAHLLSATPAMSSINDYERHAMALMALAINPYSDAGVDYITPIVASYDGTQIGTSIVHDDIFALFPLLRAGYSASDEIIQKSVAYIVSKQVNGSWGDPDTTAAAVQALSEVSSLPGVSAALANAQTYLHAAQQNNGGFGNSFSTSWVMQAIAALGQNETGWTAGGLYPRDYLATLQQSDGGVEPVSTAENTRVWTTAYAVPGALGKTWLSLLSSFSKPSTPSITGGGAATSTATSTTPVATSTPPLATTTPTSTATTTPTVGEVLGAIASAIADETPEEAFATRVTQVTENEPDAPLAPQEEATTTEEALGQLAAAATVDGVNWILVVLAFLALVLFGIVGYTQFVRKYWR